MKNMFTELKYTTHQLATVIENFTDHFLNEVNYVCMTMNTYVRSYTLKKI